MNNEFGTLSYIPLAPDSGFRHPSELPRIIHLDDPAIEVFTDFNIIHPVTVSPETPIDDAMELMKSAGVRLLLVIDAAEKIIGVITSKAITGEKPIEIVHETRAPRSEITVEMIMTPRSEIVVLATGSLLNAQVGHVVQTLHQLERRHILVVEADETTKAQRVCGLFSLSQISKQLGKDVNKIAALAHSLAEMVHERG